MRVISSPALGSTELLPGEEVNALPGDVPHASKEMMEFGRSFHDALASGRADRALKFFADDALLVHPLLHNGPPGYPIFNRGIQVLGKDAIARVMKLA